VAFRGMGVRVEDSVVVGREGPVVLTVEAVKEVVMVRVVEVVSPRLQATISLLRLLEQRWDRRLRRRFRDRMRRLCRGMISMPIRRIGGIERRVLYHGCTLTIAVCASFVYFFIMEEKDECGLLQMGSEESWIDGFFIARLWAA